MSAPPRRPVPAAAAAAPAAAPDAIGLFQGVVEHLGGVVLVCDAEGRLHWANGLAAEWLGIGGSGDPAETLLAPLPRLGQLELPWKISRDDLARVVGGETLRLRPESLRGADGVVRRCHARLTPLPRTEGASLVLAWIEPRWSV